MNNQLSLPHKLILFSLLINFLAPVGFADQSSPEKTVKEYWETQRQEIIGHAKRQIESFGVNQFYTSKVIEREKQIQQQRIDQNTSKDRPRPVIDKVDYASKTSAEVSAVEPWYSGKRHVRRYHLVKQQNRWLINDILDVCRMCEGTGQMTDLPKQLEEFDKMIYDTNPMTKCVYCEGSGWTSAFYFDWEKAKEPLKDQHRFQGLDILPSDK